MQTAKHLRKVPGFQALAPLFVLLLGVGCGNGHGHHHKPDAGHESDAGMGADAGHGDGDTDASTPADGSVPQPDASPGDAGGDGDVSMDAGGDGDVDHDAGGDGDVDHDAGGDGDTGSDAGTDGGTEFLCNGAAELCERKFNEVAFPSTHNAMSAEVEGFPHSDQRYGLERQLADGIRAMELDVWHHTPEGGTEGLYLCHGGACAASRKLSDGLKAISDFLAANPQEVFTILFEDHVPATELLAALDAAGLRAQTHDQATGQEWPTLRELIDANTRLITFFEDQGGTKEPYPTGYQVTWKYAFDTDWAFTKPTDFDDPTGADCKPLDRGWGFASELFILNQDFDTDDQAEEFAMIVNKTDKLLARAQKCAEKNMQIPNFIKVDYYDVGDLFSVVRTLNGLD
jgi:hypothetical protein